jgi:diguanylate cyclase (GGDEF)-like protein
VRKRLAIAGHSEDGLALIPLLEANPDVEVLAIATLDREAALRGLQRVEPGLADRYADRIREDFGAVLRTPGLVAIIEADPPDSVRDAFPDALERGVQVTTPLIAKLLYAFGPIDASHKPDLLQTLSEILESYNLTIDRRGLLNRVLQIAVGSTGADRGSLMLYDPETQQLAVHVAVGIEHELIPKIRIQPGEGISGRAFQERRAILLRGQADPREFEIARERQDVACAIAAPLVHNDHCIGVLNVSHGREREAFGDEELAFVEQLARLDAKIIARAQEYHELVEESGRLRIEAEVRRLLAGTRTLADRLTEICRWLARELGGGICQIYLAEPRAEALVLQASSTRIDPLSSPARLRYGEGVLGWVGASGETLLLRERVGGAEVFIAAIPLLGRDALLGVFSFEAAFTDLPPVDIDEKLRAATTALADELHDAIRELRTEQRATKMAAITEVAARMGATRELSELHRTITASAAMVLESEHAILRVQEEATGRFQIRSYFGSADTEGQSGIFALEQKLALQAVERRSPLQFAGLDEQPEFADHDTGVSAALVHPLQRDNRVIGTLSVLGRVSRQPLGGESFAEEDADLLARFAVHAQRALINVQDHERARHSQRFDDLTGLPNASLLRQRLEEEIARSSSRGRSLALVRLRVAGLAELVDAQTGAEADRLVVSLAQDLRAGLRDFDVLARTAPDTFEILLPEPDEDTSALLGPLARRAQQAIRRDLPEDAEADRLQLEFGYALYPAEAQTPAALQEKARTARIRSV